MDRTDQELRPGRAQTLFRRKRAEHANRTNAGAPGHLNVLRRVAHIDASRGEQAHLPQGQAQWLRMRFLARGISAANTRREKFRQAKLAQLTGDTVAITAGDEAKGMSAAQSCEDQASTSHQLRPILCIMRAPQAVRIIPVLPR